MMMMRYCWWLCPDPAGECVPYHYMPMRSCWWIASQKHCGYFRRSMIPFSIQLQIAGTNVSVRLKLVLVFSILVLSALIRPHFQGVRLECLHWIKCSDVSTFSHRGHLFVECIPKRWSWKNVGRILLQIFVRRTFLEILSMARERDFQAIDWMVESDQWCFVCK